MNVYQPLNSKQLCLKSTSHFHISPALGGLISHPGEKTAFSLTFFSQGSPHNVLPNVILLGQVEELADLAGSLGTKTARDGAVGQPGNVVLT